jgi:hypothetical protein
MTSTNAKVVARCIEIIREVRDGFLSEEYAVDQPLSSLSERFACDQAVAAIETEFAALEQSDAARPELANKLLGLKPFLEAHHCSTEVIDEAVAVLQSDAVLPQDGASYERGRQRVRLPNP